MLARLAKTTNVSTAETPAAPGAQQQPTAGRLPLPSQRGVPVPGQDAAGRQLRYSTSVSAEMLARTDLGLLSGGTFMIQTEAKESDRAIHQLR